MDPTAIQPPSPDQPVPDEFDLLCEHCGYSLVGLTTSNRCPECGEEFDPSALALARVPWLFRKRLGTIAAYRETVWEIITNSKRFAKELCRPVRICISDARAFRRMSVRIALLSSILGGLIFGVISVSLSWTNLWAYRSSYSARDYQAFVTGLLAVPWMLIVLNILFRLATDLPTFIWKGLEDNPIDLAPLHHYASAPLALMPILVVPLTVTAILFRIGSDDYGQMASVVQAIFVLVFLALLWVIPLRFMKQATGCGAKRVVALALYLPAHWLLILFMCMLLYGVGCLTISKVIEWVWW
jgi:hypothetical protein